MIKTYKTRILLTDSHGWETWPLNLREEHRQRLSDNRVLKGTY